MTFFHVSHADLRYILQVRYCNSGETHPGQPCRSFSKLPFAGKNITTQRESEISHRDDFSPSIHLEFMTAHESSIEATSSGQSTQ